MSSIIIIHRPNAAVRAFVAAVASSPAVEAPLGEHLVDLCNKDALTPQEVKFLQHCFVKYGFEVVDSSDTRCVPA